MPETRIEDLAAEHRRSLADLGWEVGPIETIDGEVGFRVLRGGGGPHARTFDARGGLRVVRPPRPPFPQSRAEYAEILRILVRAKIPFTPYSGCVVVDEVEGKIRTPEEARAAAALIKSRRRGKGRTTPGAPWSR